MPVYFENKAITPHGFVSTIIEVSTASELNKAILEDLKEPDPKKDGGETHDDEV